MSDQESLLPSRRGVSWQRGSSSRSATSDAQQAGVEDGLSRWEKSHGSAFDVLDGKLISGMLCFFTAGLQMAALGVLILPIEKHYSVTDGSAAAIFVANTFGYVSSATMLSSVVTRHGWRGVAVLSPPCWVASSLLLALAPPYWLVLVASLIAGFGTGLSDAGLNARVSRLRHANLAQGFMHGSYSVGCVLSPILVAALFKAGYHWTLFYRIMILVSLMNCAALTLAFRHETAEKLKMSHQVVLAADDSHDSGAMNHALRYRATWVCGIFYFCYVAVENSYTDWIVTYASREWHVPLETASLSSSWFWIGMALGRFALGAITERLGLVKSVSAYIVCSAGFQFLFRFAHGNVAPLFGLLTANAFFLGPIFPSGVNLLSSKLSAEACVGAVAAASAMGQVGGALAPLAVGVLSDKFGIGHLLDIVLPITALLLLIWLAFARIRGV